MPTILPFGDTDDELSSSSATERSTFRDIVNLACSQVDAFQRTPTEFRRRIIARKKVALRAECSGAWGSSPCLISDFGDGGLAIVCGHPHKVGDVIHLSWSFDLQSSGVEVDCEVRHVTGPHIGACFLNVTSKERVRLIETLRRATTGKSTFAA